MKRFLVILMLGLFCGVAQAQRIQWYKATEFAAKWVENNYWTDWTDWIDTDINVKIDLSKDMVVIYSESPQVYKVIRQVEAPYDDSGVQVKFKIIDQDNDVGYLRLRIENNGNSQIYIDFADIMWVYNVTRIK